MDTGTIINILLLGLVVVFVFMRFKPLKGLRSLDADAFKAELAKPSKPLLIDVREPSEYKGGYIAGAKNIPLSQLSGRLSEIPKTQQVLLYCRSGMRSKTAAKLLLRHGHQEMIQLQGGLGGWKGELARK